eukprot:scaffold17851_cov34-Prasinocladus_malaysianus.AAC.1
MYRRCATNCRRLVGSVCLLLFRCRRGDQGLGQGRPGHAGGRQAEADRAAADGIRKLGRQGCHPT